MEGGDGMGMGDGRALKNVKGNGVEGRRWWGWVGVGEWGAQGG